jgi:L-fucose isomerase-like protein
MQKITVLYLPIGRRTFDMETAEQYREHTVRWLTSMCQKVISPTELITSVEELEQFLQRNGTEPIDVVIYQSTTFADGEFPRTLIKMRKEPVIVWSVREPSVGGRLRLNSLTGGNSTCNVLKNHNHPFSFIFGNPEEEKLEQQLKVHLNVAYVLKKLNELKIGVIGEHPPGFYFSDTKEEELKRLLGVSIEKLDLFQAFEECKHIPKEEWELAVEKAEKQVIGLNRHDETVQRFAQFYTYVKKRIQHNHINALAIRCWPDFFNKLGASACSALSQFIEEGIVSACESDIHGSISMYILHELSGGKAPYLGDLVHVNEENNSVVFWHCGAGAYSLASSVTGAKAGVHPNRKIGLTMDFCLKAGKVSIFRLSYTPKGYRLLVMEGEALETEQPFSGTSVEVALKTDVTSTLYELMRQGFEPHYALVYEDIVEELLQLGKQLEIETVYYGS